MSIDLLFTGAAEIFTGHAALTDPDPVLAVSDGEIAYIGPRAGLDSTRLTDRTKVVDVTGLLLTPGLVDPHTHVVFAGDRSGEYAMRAAGRSYLEIAQAGGGIVSTMRATRETRNGKSFARCSVRSRLVVPWEMFQAYFKKLLHPAMHGALWSHAKAKAAHMP